MKRSKKDQQEDKEKVYLKRTKAKKQKRNNLRDYKSSDTYFTEDSIESEKNEKENNKKNSIEKQRKGKVVIKRKLRKRTAIKFYSSSEDDNKENENSSFEVEEIKKKHNETCSKTKETSKKAKPVLIDSSNDEIYGVDDKNLDEDLCVECLDYYSNSKSKVDWICCVMCRKWLHETCTLYRNYCNKCGRMKIVAAKMVK